MHHAKRTIRALQALGFLFMFVPAVPLLQYIYTAQGLTQTQIGTVQIVVWFTILLTDLPTGRLADEYSYKRMLIAAGGFYGASFGLLAYATTYWMFIVASVLWGLGTSCFRGVPNSLARLAIESETTDASEVSKRFTSFVRNSLILAAAGEVTASGVAWLIVNYGGSSGLRYVSLSTVGVAALMLAITTWGVTNLRPQTHHIPPPFLVTVRSGWAKTAKNVRDAFTASSQLRAILLFGAVIGCTTQTMVWLSQVYLQRTGVSAKEVPLVWMMYHVALAGFVLLAAPLKSKHGTTKLLSTLPLLAVAGYLALIVVPAYIGHWVVLVFYLIRAIQMQLIQVAMNHLSPEHLRATLTSVLSTVQFSFFCVMHLAISWLVDAFSEVGNGTELALGFSGVVYGLLGYVAIRYVRRHEPRE